MFSVPLTYNIVRVDTSYAGVKFYFHGEKMVGKYVQKINGKMTVFIFFPNINRKRQRLKGRMIQILGETTVKR